MHLKEYRICMPLTVEEYHIGQLYMITKHCHEQSKQGEGVEVVKNEPCEHPEHGKGQYTEKRIYLSSRLPSWLKAMIPKIFYVTEKAWNFYPVTVTEYTCSFIPRFSIHIDTVYEDNRGTSENSLNLTPEELEIREIDEVDIVFDTLPEKHYRPEEDLKTFKSEKSGRGPLKEAWKENTVPVMCSYKVVKVKFEVWGMQGKVESFTQKAIRDILLLGHRQAFAWIDEWIDMTIEDIRDFENSKQKETNDKVMGATEGSSVDDIQSVTDGRSTAVDGNSTEEAESVTALPSGSSIAESVDSKLK